MKFLSTTERTKLSPLLLILVTLSAVSCAAANVNSRASKNTTPPTKPQLLPGQHKQTIPQPVPPIRPGANISPNQYGNKPFGPGTGPQQKPQNKNAAPAVNRGSGFQTGLKQNAKQVGPNLQSANQTPNGPTHMQGNSAQPSNQNWNEPLNSAVQTPNWPAPMQGNSAQPPNQNLNRNWQGQNPTGNSYLTGGNPNGNQQQRNNNAPGNAASGKIGQWQTQTPWQNNPMLKNADGSQNGATPKAWAPRPGAAKESDMNSYQLSNTGGTQTGNNYRQPNIGKSGGPVSQTGSAPVGSGTKPELETKASITGSPFRVNKPRIITDPYGKTGRGGGGGFLGWKSRGNSTSTMANPKYREAVERVKYVMISVVMTVVGLALMALTVMASVAKRRRRQRYMRCEGFGDECELRSNFQLVNNDERLGLRNSANYFM